MDREFGMEVLTTSRDGACRSADHYRGHSRIRADAQRRPGCGRGRDGSGGGGADPGGRRRRQQWRRRFCGGSGARGPRPRGIGHPVVRAGQFAGRCGLGGEGLEVSGAAVQSAGDRQARADHRCAVRRRSQPAGRGRTLRDDRGDQRQRRAGSQRRPAERHQRHHRRGHGHRHQRHRDGDVLPAQAGAFAAAGPDACRPPGTRRRYRHRPRRARGDQAADFRERSASLAPVVSGAADRRP